jgi:hypothetical protein
VRASGSCSKIPGRLLWHSHQTSDHDSKKRNGNSKENGEISSSDQVQEVMLLLERNPYDQFVQL